MPPSTLGPNELRLKDITNWSAYYLVAGILAALILAYRVTGLGLPVGALLWWGLVQFGGTLGECELAFWMVMAFYRQRDYRRMNKMAFVGNKTTLKSAHRSTFIVLTVVFMAGIALFFVEIYDITVRDIELMEWITLWVLSLGFEAINLGNSLIWSYLAATALDQEYQAQGKHYP